MSEKPQVMTYVYLKKKEIINTDKLIHSKNKSKWKNSKHF